jgi:hypothetical protein
MNAAGMKVLRSLKVCSKTCRIRNYKDRTMNILVETQKENRKQRDTFPKKEWNPHS